MSGSYRPRKCKNRISEGTTLILTLGDDRPRKRLGYRIPTQVFLGEYSGALNIAGTALIACIQDPGKKTKTSICIFINTNFSSRYCLTNYYFLPKNVFHKTNNLNCTPDLRNGEDTLIIRFVPSRFYTPTFFK